MKERFFIGIEYDGGAKLGEVNNFGQLWSTFLNEDLKLLGDLEHLSKFIGLECYSPDVMETRMYDYFALIETSELVKRPGFVSKKLPEGEYIFFEIEFDDIHQEIQKVYQYVKSKNINIHQGFDFEDYLPEYDYTKGGAKLNFAMMLENDK